MRAFRKDVVYWGKVIVLGVILGVGIQFARAWTEPTLPPPGGNVAGPLTTGAVDQVKSAGLGLVGNLVVGAATGAPQNICLNGDCRTAWPNSDYNSLPAGSVAGYCSTFFGCPGDSCFDVMDKVQNTPAIIPARRGHTFQGVWYPATNPVDLGWNDCECEDGWDIKATGTDIYSIVSTAVESGINNAMAGIHYFSCVKK